MSKNMQGIKFERFHRPGNRNDSSPGAIVAICITYRAMEYMLCKATFLKRIEYFINEDFLKETQAY